MVVRILEVLASLALGFPAWAEPILPHTLSLPAQCEQLLRGGEPASLELLGRLSQAKIRRNDHTGILLEVNPSWPVYSIKLAEPEIVPWSTKLWSDSKNSLFRYMNVGFPNLASRSEQINKLVGIHLMLGEKTNVMFSFGRVRSEQERVLSNLRWTFHQLVLETYRKRSKNVSEDGMAMLNLYNMNSNNNDVFGLMAGDSLDESVANLNPTEIERDLKETIQISYHGDRDFLAPSPNGVLQAVGFPVDDSTAKLPFEYRIDPAHLQEFRRHFYGRFPAKNTAEFARYAKFARIPKEVHDLFVVQVFATAMMRGVRYIVASVDPVTLELFQRGYGFKLYQPLPVNPRLQQKGKGGEPEPEFVAYLDLASPEFQAMFNKMVWSSSAVKQETDEFQ